MSSTDFISLSPLIAVSLASVVVMMAIAFHRSHDLSAGITAVGLVVALFLLPVAAVYAPHVVTTGGDGSVSLLVVDHFAIFYTGMVLLAALTVALLCHGYFARFEGYPEEFYVLLLLSAAGAGAMVSSRHFTSFYLGLEVLSVSLYTMIGYLSNARRSTEAGLKYLMLAAAAAAFLLFGMALVYAETGTMAFDRLEAVVAGSSASDLLIAGFAFILVGLGFKLSLVPFHMWTPDVYEGAPAPVTAYVATVSKGAVLALFLRFFAGFSDPSYRSLYLAVSLIAVASMFVGNLLALLQNNVKRILAYSSIAHMGYVLVAYLAGGTAAVEAVTYYLVAYFITTLGAFGVVTLLSSGDPGHERDGIEDYRGLFWLHPWLALVFTAMLLSLAGIPLTAGFIGKFYVVKAGVQGALWWQLAAVVLNSAIGLYYYLRIAIVLYAPAPEERPAAPAAPFPAMGSAALAVLTFFLLWAGIFPEPLARWIQTLTPGH